MLQRSDALVPQCGSSGSPAMRLVIATLLVFSIWILGESSAFAFQADAEPAAGENADAADQPDSAAEAEPTPESRSFLGLLVEASGIFGFILLLLSFLMIALIVMNLLQVRRESLLPEDFINAFEQKLTAEDYQGAFEFARSDESFIARVLAAGMGRLNRGYSALVEGMQEVGEDENMALEHRLSYLALIGSIAPMIGLMGTVYGMIMSFERIAQSTVSPKPSELAEGIMTALFTTLEGLVVAVPALVFYSILRNRVSRFVLEVGIVSEGLMSRFSNVERQKRPASSKPAAQNPPPSAKST